MRDFHISYCRNGSFRMKQKLEKPLYSKATTADGDENDDDDDDIEYQTGINRESRPSALDEDILELFKHREVEPALPKTTPPVSIVMYIVHDLYFIIKPGIIFLKF